jgi:hypothetical protein
MPLALDPSKTFDVVLASDLDKDPQPTFRFRYANGREWIAIAETADALQQQRSGADALRKIYDILRMPLVGWENMGGVAFKPEDLDLILNPGEAQELLEKIMANIRPSDAEKNG